jgi:hypothetical protein
LFEAPAWYCVVAGQAAREVPGALPPPVLRLLETKKPILVASASVCAPQDPWPLVAAELDTAGHQSFVSASCSCDNRLLRVITIPVTTGSHAGIPPHWNPRSPAPPVRGFFVRRYYFADRRIACSAAKSFTDSLTAPPPVSDHQMLHVMQALTAIVDLNQRTLAFKAKGLGAFFRHWSSVFSPRSTPALARPSTICDEASAATCRETFPSAR